ncbi:MAG: RNA 2',3'-cyclic phosphodiesterase [Candidatus Atribacteria bacterium]|nr:RNA 2',3'-cyclic phosphodiesterase [Candidatus Atribacteria bacterium]MCD6349926.1 RNA 2',3'-cyclic phosphodiesterase [Candidatus Atribacteria bacterium]
MKNETTLRCFIALDLEEATKEVIARFIGNTKSLFPEAKWVNVQQTHLTLRFFGAINSDQLPLLSSIIKQIAASFQAIPALINRVGVFPEPKRARVIWIVFDAQAEVKNKEITEKLNHKLWESLKIEAEEKSFIPHITIARLRKPRKVAIENLRLPESIPTNLYRITIYKSALTPRGPIYSELSSYPLTLKR